MKKSLVSYVVMSAGFLSIFGAGEASFAASTAPTYRYHCVADGYQFGLSVISKERVQFLGDGFTALLTRNHSGSGSFYEGPSNQGSTVELSLENERATVSIIKGKSKITRDDCARGEPGPQTKPLGQSQSQPQEQWQTYAKPQDAKPQDANPVAPQVSRFSCNNGRYRFQLQKIRFNLFDMKDSKGRRVTMRIVTSHPNQRMQGKDKNGNPIFITLIGKSMLADLEGPQGKMRCMMQ